MSKKAKPLLEPQDERFQMRASASFLREIDEWRRQQSDIPTRTEAIRRLVQQALSKGPKK
jgi:hypothetical protein